METTSEDKKKADLKAYKKKYYQEHKEIIKERTKKYRTENVNKIKTTNQLYRKTNKEKIRNSRKNYRTKNKEKIKIRNIKYYKENVDKIKADKKSYYSKNIELFRNKNKKYREKNAESIRLQHKNYERCKAKTDPLFRMMKSLRTRHRLALKSQGATKDITSKELFGASKEEVWKHLESQFKEGMTRENHGFKGWHIDHIKPMSSFDLSNPEQLKECCHYTNLQPLWWWENLKKSDKIV